MDFDSVNTDKQGGYNDKKQKTRRIADEDECHKSCVSFCNQVGSFLDSFGQSYSQRVDRGGERPLTSIVGMLMSLLLAGLVVSYSLQKLGILMLKRDNDITMSDLVHFYDETETFTNEQGFNVAFMFNDGNGEGLTDDYGYFDLYSNEWFIDENG